MLLLLHRPASLPFRPRFLHLQKSGVNSLSIASAVLKYPLTVMTADNFASIAPRVCTSSEPYLPKTFSTMEKKYC